MCVDLSIIYGLLYAIGVISTLGQFIGYAARYRVWGIFEEKLAIGEQEWAGPLHQ